MGGAAARSLPNALIVPCRRIGSELQGARRGDSGEAASEIGGHEGGGFPREPMTGEAREKHPSRNPEAPRNTTLPRQPQGQPQGSDRPFTRWNTDQECFFAAQGGNRELQSIVAECNDRLNSRGVKSIFLFLSLIHVAGPALLGFLLWACLHGFMPLWQAMLAMGTVFGAARFVIRAGYAARIGCALSMATDCARMRLHPGAVAALLWHVREELLKLENPRQTRSLLSGPVLSVWALLPGLGGDAKRAGGWIYLLEKLIERSYDLARRQSDGMKSQGLEEEKLHQDLGTLSWLVDALTSYAMRYHVLIAACIAAAMTLGSALIR